MVGEQQVREPLGPLLLVLHQKANEKLLEKSLKNRYPLLIPEDPSLEGIFLEGRFSLGIVDGPVLQTWRVFIERRRERERPVFLPFMLITSRRDLGLAQHFLWKVVDEVITTPVEQVELLARIENLLTVRRLSLQLYAQYQRLFDNVPLGLYRTSLTGTILDANPALANEFGFANPEDIIGRNALEFYVNPQDRKAWQDVMEREGKVTRFQCRLRRRSGEVFWASLSIQRVVDERGNFLYYEGSIEDITERVTYEERLKEALAKLGQSFNDLVLVLSRLVEIRDPYTAGHQKRVAQLARAIACRMELGENEIREIYIAGLLHDIGKVAIPGEILNKPATLTPLERAIVEEHPKRGYEVICSVDILRPLAEIVLQHHERLDGSGYPRKLRNGEILLAARILAVADVVEAMVHHRPYRPPLSLEETLFEIVANRGTLYDEAVVDACCTLFRKEGFAWED